MSKHRLLGAFSRKKDSSNLPAEYIQDRMEDENVNLAMGVPLQFVARINSFGTPDVEEKLQE